MKTLRHLRPVSRQFVSLSAVLVQVRHYYYCISVRDKAAQTCAKSWKPPHRFNAKRLCSRFSAVLGPLAHLNVGQEFEFASKMRNY